MAISSASSGRKKTMNDIDLAKIERLENDANCNVENIYVQSIEDVMMSWGRE